MTPASAVCFELSDEFSLYTQYPPGRSEEAHREMVDLVRRSDLVFATARSLAEEFSPYRRNAYWIPNTAPPSDFRIDPGTGILPELKRIPGPIIGFVGGLNPWIDIPLLLRIQELRPQWSLDEVRRLVRTTRHTDT